MEAAERDTTSTALTVQPSPAGPLGQLSRSDAPRWIDGQSFPDDYVARLANPVTRMQLFEEMRASDDAVDTPIDTRIKALLASNWMLSSEDESEQGRKILEFCEDNIYPVLDEIIEHLAGALQYGFAVFEPVYALADAPFATNVARGKVKRAVKTSGRYIYLQRIAPIRQRTIYTFRVAPTGELIEIVQHVTASGRWTITKIPPEKVVLWTYRKQGDDYWGVPPLRSLVKAWEFKRQLENLSMLGFDRFGVGTPVITGGQDWSDDDFDKAFEFLKRLRSGAAAGLVAPHGGTASIVGGDAALAMGFLENIKWYAGACAKAYGTQSSELGSTETGSRAVGDTMSESLEQRVQSDAEKIAALLNERVIVSIVQWNFGPQQTYPCFAPSGKASKEGTLAADVGGLISSKAVKWTAKDEAWVRDAEGMPEIDVAARQAEMDADAELQKQQAAALANADPAADPKAPVDELAAKRAEKKAATLRRLTRTLSVPDPAAPGASYRTAALDAWEATIVKPTMLARDLDVQAARLTGEVQTILHAIDVELEAQVHALAGEGPAALASGLDRIRVPERYREELRVTLTAAVQRASARGAAAVQDEIDRQQQPDVAAPARFVRALATQVRRFFRDPAADARAELAAQLRAQIERAVEEECARREQAARAAAAAALAAAPTAPPEELAPIAKSRTSGALEDLSTSRTEANVAQVVNAGFGTGRRQAIDTAITEHDVAALVYSATMDGGTCTECEKWDGAQFPPDYDQDAPGAVKAPNPNCAGGAHCRCIWVVVLADEAKPIVGPTRGPLGPGEQP